MDKKPKGTTINDLGGGPEEIEKKKIFEALLQEKKIYKGLLREKICRGIREEKINSFSIFPPGPPPPPPKKLLPQMRIVGFGE